MSDLYLAEDGTIRSRSGRAETRHTESASETSRSTNPVLTVPDVSLGIKCLYWIASLVVAAVIALIGCSLFSESIANNSDILASAYVSVLIFIGAYVGIITHAAIQSDYSGLNFFFGLLCAVGGVIAGALLGALTPILIGIFILTVIVAGFLNAD